MTDTGFDYYKAQMRAYQAAAISKDPSYDGPDICAIVDNMRETFPKKPGQTDKLALCSGYWYRSQLPMEPNYVKDWRKQIKSYINASEQGQNDRVLYLLMFHLERTADVCPKKETFDYGEKAAKKIAKQNRNHPKVQEVLGRLALPYYEELLAGAIKMPDTDDNYSKRIKAFDKVRNVLLKIPQSVRYKKMYELMDAMRPVYMSSEWGQHAFGRVCASIRHSIYKSMPSHVQSEIRNAQYRRDWNNR